MSDLIHQHTQTTKNGTSEIKRKPGRPAAKITEIDRDLSEDSPIDPKKVATAEDIETAYPPEAAIVPNFGLGVVKTYEEFHTALSAAQMRDDFEDEKFIELTPEMFKLVTQNQKCDVLIKGEPPVWVYVAGTRRLVKKNNARKADDPPFKE